MEENGAYTFIFDEQYNLLRLVDTDPILSWIPVTLMFIIFFVSTILIVIAKEVYTNYKKIKLDS